MVSDIKYEVLDVDRKEFIFLSEGGKAQIILRVRLKDNSKNYVLVDLLVMIRGERQTVIMEEAEYGVMYKSVDKKNYNKLFQIFKEIMISSNLEKVNE